MLQNGKHVLCEKPMAVTAAEGEKMFRTAKENGVPCVWWDNGYYTSGNELFGIFDRHNCTWFTDTVVDAMMKVYE